jgi:type IV pilus assembly protein PilM
MNGTSKLESRLKLACEISASHVVAGRASDNGSAIETCAVRTLPSGAVAPCLTTANVTNRDALATAIADVMTTVGARQRDVIAVIPDAACRTVLLDFDTLPQKPQEADSVVRFRLKKSVPFEVEHACLSYDVRRADSLLRVVAVVALPTVIEEYESAFRQAGLAPGFVVPSTIASLGIVDASRPTLVLNISTDATSIAIVNNDDLVLFRTTENSEDRALEPEQIADDIYPSLVFFQDTYGAKIDRILVGGAPSFEPIAQAIEAGVGVRPQEIVPQHALSSASIGSSQRSFVSGIMGALIS